MKAAGLKLVLEVIDRLGANENAVLDVTLTPAALHDFTPDGILAAVPALEALRTLREAIACLLGPWFSKTVPEFRAELLALLRSSASRATLCAELQASETPLLDRVAALTGLTIEDGDAYILLRDCVRAFISVAAEDEVGPGADDLLLPRLIVELDRRLDCQINEILHHPEFQALESAWRSLDFLLQRIDLSENTKLEFVNLTKEDLRSDFDEAANITQSWLYRTVYSGGYGTFGSTPYGVACVLHEFDRSPIDLYLLTRCSAIGALSHTPFLVAASPRIFRIEKFSQLSSLRSVRELFDPPYNQQWDRLRDSLDSRYLGICLPRVLLRAPYIGSRGAPERWQTFQFIENADADEQHYVWGSASLVMVSRIADSFAKYRWCPHIIGVKGGGEENGLPSHRVTEDLDVPTVGPCDVSIGDRMANELGHHGFICLRVGMTSSQAVFFSVPALQRPQAGSATNPRESRLASTLTISRVAQYVKVVYRELTGTTGNSIQMMQKKINDWLRQYVNPITDASMEIRSCKPFRSASIALGEVPGQIEWYRYQLSIEPHLRASDGNNLLSVVGKLDRF